VGWCQVALLANLRPHQGVQPQRRRLSLRIGPLASQLGVLKRLEQADAAGQRALVFVFGAKIVLLHRIGHALREALRKGLTAQQPQQDATQQPPENKAQHAEDVAAKHQQHAAIDIRQPVRKRRRTVQLVDQQKRRQTARARDDKRQIEDVKEGANPAEQRLERLRRLVHDRDASRRPG